MIVAWGLREDPTMAWTLKALRDIKAPVFFLDQARSDQMYVKAEIGDDISGSIKIGHKTLDLQSVRSVYKRQQPQENILLRNKSIAKSAVGKHITDVEKFIRLWLDNTSALVLNPTSGSATNFSKSYQSTLIRAHSSFSTPETLITTSTSAVKAFRDRHGEIICKSGSSSRSMAFKWTSELDHRLAYLKSCPTQFQQLIKGVEYRAHVVGDEVFACEIITDAVDYRYAGRTNTPCSMRPYALPPQIANNCRKLAQALNIPFPGIDLKRTADDEWFCFEVNPAPGYEGYDIDCDLGIAKALARYLTSANVVK